MAELSLQHNEETPAHIEPARVDKAEHSPASPSPLSTSIQSERPLPVEAIREQLQDFRASVLEARDLVKDGSADGPYLQMIASLVQKGDRLSSMLAPHVDANQDGASDASLRYFERARSFHTATESILTVDSLRTHLARITLASHGLVRSVTSLLDAKEKEQGLSTTKAPDTDRSLSEKDHKPEREASDLKDPTGSKTPSYSPRVRSFLKVMGVFNKAVDSLIDVCVTASNPIKAFKALSESKSFIGQLTGYSGWTLGLLAGGAATVSLLPWAVSGSVLGIGFATAAAMTTPLLMSMGAWIGNEIGARISGFFGTELKNETRKTFERYYEKENKAFEESAGVFTDASGLIQKRQEAYEISRGKKMHLLQRLGPHSEGLLEYALDRATEKQDSQGEEKPLLLSEVLEDAYALQEKYEDGSCMFYPNGKLTQHGYTQIASVLKDVDPHMEKEETAYDALRGALNSKYAAEAGYTDLEKDLHVQTIAEYLLAEVQSESSEAPESYDASMLTERLKESLAEQKPRKDASGAVVGTWEVPDISIEYDVPSDFVDTLHSLGKIIGGVPFPGIPVPSMIGAAMCSLSAVLAVGRDLFFGDPEKSVEGEDKQSSAVSRFFTTLRDSGVSFFNRVKDGVFCLLPGIGQMNMYNELRRYRGFPPGTLESKEEGPTFAEIRKQIGEWLSKPQKWERFKGLISRFMTEYETVNSAKRRKR